MKDNILFTSAGDTTYFYNLWCKSNRNYDVFICYYGDDKYNKFEEYSDFYMKRKGSKMQNFYYLWINNISNIKNYKQYYIVDDDIIIETDEINELFKLLTELNAWVLQPSFSEKSKVSHQITRQNKESKYRFTNFVEINTPFFSQYAIHQCMKIYDPILVGWGCDILFINYLGKNQENKFVIVDYISCVNPIQKVREIDKLQSLSERVDNWNTWKKQIQKEIKIEHIIQKNFTFVK